MNVHLRDFISLPGARISHINKNDSVSCRQDGRRFNMKIIEFEGRIAQSVAEGKQRLAPRIDKVATIPGRLVVVEIWKLADGFRKGNRKFASRVRIAKDYVRGCGSSLLTEIPAFENCRHVLFNVVD